MYAALSGAVLEVMQCLREFHNIQAKGGVTAVEIFKRAHVSLPLFIFLQAQLGAGLGLPGLNCPPEDGWCPGRKMSLGSGPLGVRIWVTSPSRTTELPAQQEGHSECVVE